MIMPSINKLFCVVMLLALMGGSYSVAVGQTKKDRQKADKLVKTGVTSFDKKDYRTAVTRFDEAIALNSKSGEAYFRKARAHFALGEYEQAAAAFDLALANGHEPMEVYRERWAAYNKLKKYDEALADVNKVLAAEPKNQGFLVAAADINFENGSFKEAAAAYEQIIPTAPNAADLYYKVAVAKSKAGDTEGQAVAAETAIARNTQYLAESLQLLGEARFAQKRIPEAIQAYSRALTSKPDKPEPYRHLAELYRTQNEIEEGIKTLEKARSLNTMNGEIYMDLSLFYSLAEKTEEAVAAGRSATTLLPNNALAHTRLCRALATAKKPELAISSCNTARRIAPDDPETLFYLARANSDLGTPSKKAEAEKYYNQALTILQTDARERPEDPDVHYMLGNVYADMQQNSQAVSAYEKALALNPRYTRAQFNIAVIRLNENNKAAALERYTSLLTSDKVLAERLKKLIDSRP
jgi:tetratricopeptide (TPR) repeat protein